VSGPPADDAPPAPARLGRWVMALVRLGAGWLVVARPLLMLAAGPAALDGRLAGAARIALAALLGIGLGAFAWPRSCPWGLGLLLAGLGAFEWRARSLGLPPTPHLASAAAILAVLAAGEWLTRRVGARR